MSGKAKNGACLSNTVWTQLAKDLCMKTVWLSSRNRSSLGWLFCYLGPENAQINAFSEVVVVLQNYHVMESWQKAYTPMHTYTHIHTHGETHAHTHVHTYAFPSTQEYTHPSLTYIHTPLALSQQWILEMKLVTKRIDGFSHATLNLLHLNMKIQTRKYTKRGRGKNPRWKVPHNPSHRIF